MAANYGNDELFFLSSPWGKTPELLRIECTEQRLDVRMA
jgi:hypothetical protein